jgi:hypothetical protein
MRGNLFLVVENVSLETLSDVELVHIKDFLPSSLGTNLNLCKKDRLLFKPTK